MNELTVQTIEEKDITIVKPSPFELANDFLRAGGDVAMLEKMLSFQERYDAIQAKKAYVQAMSDFKKNPPKIYKNKQVGFESRKPGSAATNYKHATLGNVTQEINASLAEHDLTAAWTPEQKDNGIKVTCTITHKLGHSESVSLFAPADSTGNKNSIQAIGSTITYLERYTLLAITGLATHDQDDDGNSFGVELINTDQAIVINDKLKETKSNIDVFLKYIGCNSVEEIPASKYGMAINALKKKESKK